MSWAIRFGFVIASASAAVSLGCSSSSDESSGGSESAVKIHIETQIEAGDEIQKCRYWQLPSDRGPLAIGNMQHSYSPGSHHFLVYSTEMKELPAGGEELVDCEESNWMSDVRGVVYAAQQPKGSFEVPEGVAQLFEPGAVVLVQSHYLNATTKTLDAKIDLTMDLVEPAAVTTEAGVLFFFNPAIHVPASTKGSAEMTCPLGSDTTLAFASSHMHRRGVNYRAENTDAAVTAEIGPLFETTEWNEPVPRVFPLEPPTVLPGATSIKFRCDYDNIDPNDIVMGFSAEKNEMCMFVGMYWPRQNKAVEFCYDGAVTATGKSSAVDTMKCFVACGGTQNAACAGACWDKACPKAPTAMFGFAECVPDSCYPDCFIDPAGEKCAACAKPACETEYNRVIAATCG